METEVIGEFCTVPLPHTSLMSTTRFHDLFTKASTKQQRIEVMAAYICSHGGFANSDQKVRIAVGDGDAWERVRSLIG